MKLLKFYLKSCGPCKVLDNNLQMTGLPYESIDVESEEGAALSRQYEVRGIPTLILLNDNGEVVKRQVGIMFDNEIKKFYNE